MASPRTTVPISSSACSFSPWAPTATSPSRFAAATATPAIPALTSRRGTHCAPWRVGRTSSTSPIPSCVRARTWTISIAPAAASSPCCRALVRRRRVSPMDPNTYAGLDLRSGPSPPPPCRWTARPLVRLSAAIAVGGGLDGGLAVEHAAHLASGGEAEEEHGRRKRKAHQLTRAARRAKDQIAARRRYRFSRQDHPREAPRCSLPQGRAHRARRPHL